jgi:hypothetical protein
MRPVLAFICSIALLAACGSDSGRSGGASTTPPTATTSTAAPQSTVALPTVPASSAPITVATVAPTEPATTEPDVTEPETSSPTDPTDTAPEDSTSPSGGTVVDGSSISDEYVKVSPPTVPTTTAAVHADNSHPDGVYYATVTEDGDPPPADGSVVFEVVQLFVGDDCTEHFGADDEEACVNDYGVETDPTATLEVPLTGADDVGQDSIVPYITVTDAATQDSLMISGAELYGLIHGEDPSPGAPEDYLYSGFGFLVTLSGGVVTRLEQWWTP